MFAFKNGSNLTGQSANGLITGINQVPSALHCLSRKRHVVLILKGEERVYELRKLNDDGGRRHPPFTIVGANESELADDGALMGRQAPLRWRFSIPCCRLTQDLELDDVIAMN